MAAISRHLPSWARRAARVAAKHVAQAYPSYFVRNLPRALHPRTFEDKVRRRMLFDRRPILVTFADKVLARAYVHATVGEAILTHAYTIVDDARGIDWGALPRTFVGKATHGSGGVIVVSDAADPRSTLPDPERARWNRFYIHPDRADPAAMTAICERWLRTRFGWGPGSTHEWQYRCLTPRVLIEEYLRGPDGDPAADYKFDVFHGRCRLIRVISRRMRGKRIAAFWPDWTPIPEGDTAPPPDALPACPANLDEMLRIAEALSGGIDFVRVDLYAPADGRIVFGELTGTPSAGRGSIAPKLARTLAGYW